MQFGCGSNRVQLILLFVVTAVVLASQNVDGFSVLGSIACGRGALSKTPSVVVSARYTRSSAVEVYARRRSEDIPKGSNPKLRGIRQYSVGQKHRTWMENYRALLEYKEKHHHCRVPHRYKEDRALGSWVYFQRKSGRQSLSSKQLQLLHKVGFDWETQAERNDRIWQESYQKLIVYNERIGDCHVPKIYGLDPGLGGWVHTQRRMQKQGRLRTDRDEQLDAIGFTWSLKTGAPHVNTEHYDSRWDELFGRLQEFRMKWGHCLVPKHFEEDPALGRWVETQRSWFQNGLLRPDRKKRLDEVEFEYSVTNTTIPDLNGLYWNLMYQRLVDFKETNGHANVPTKYDEHGLGLWVVTQRRKISTMDDRRRKRLDSIGFPWSNPCNKPALWQERFEELCAYRKLHGTCRVKTRLNSRLCSWVIRQRKQMKNGTMSLARAKKLESIGFD